MDDLLEQIEHLENEANLSSSLADVQRALDLLTSARAKLIVDPEMAPMTLAKLQGPLQQSMEAANKDLLPIYKALGKYSKSLDKVLFYKTLLTISL
jgi:hypothetical protein